LEFEMIGRHVDLTDPVKAYLTERGDRLAKFFDRIHSLKVIISAEGANNVVEFVAHLVKADTVVSKGAAPDLFAAIEEAANRMEEQLRRYKEKLRGHRTKGEEAGAAAAVPGAEGAVEEAEVAPPIEEIEDEGTEKR
jgi:putative sigma-54 modulation protein